MRREIPWTTLLIEGVAIVISILLAFAIDAWWDERKDRAEEIEILIGLETEFVDLRERLILWGKFNQTSATLIERFLSDEVNSMDLPEVEDVFMRSFLANVLDQGGPLDALLSSGRLEQIGDREIRDRLAKWPDWLEDIHTNDVSIRDFSWREIAPYLARHGIPDTVCPERQWRCLESGIVPQRYLALAADSEFRALMIIRRLMSWSTAHDHGNAREQADEVLELIRERLTELGGREET